MLNGFRIWVLKSFLFLTKLIVVVGFILLSIFFSMKENNTAIIVFAGFSLFFTLFFFGSNFEIVELLGAKFKLREIKNSLEELRLLAKETTSVLLENVQIAGRWGGFSTHRKKEIFENSIEILRKLDVADEKIKEAKQQYIFWTKFDYLHFINACIAIKAQKISREMPERQDILEKFNEVIKQLKVINRNNIIEWNELEKILQGLFPYDSDLNQIFEDYKYYSINFEHQSFERWIKYNKEEG